MASDNDHPALPPRNEVAVRNGDRVRAFLVHIFTASGAALALLALIAASQLQWTLMFVWLGIALIVDGLDGPIARRLKVGETLPRWSGDVLDLVVDYLTYVFIPAYAMTMSGLLPQSLAIPLGVAVAMTGVIYFADRNMKFADNCFRGFPTLWNVVALYLFVLKPSPPLAALLIILCSIWTFLPWRFVHPLRVVYLRTVTLAAVGVWSAFAITAVAFKLEPPMWVRAGLVGIGLYIAVIGMIQGVITRR